MWTRKLAGRAIGNTLWLTKAAVRPYLVPMPRFGTYLDHLFFGAVYSGSKFSIDDGNRVACITLKAHGPLSLNIEPDIKRHSLQARNN